MGFAQEMKDFLGAWQAGEKINASRTDREYRTALTDAQKKKTERENDPDTVALEHQTAQARLKQLNANIGATNTSAAATRANMGLNDIRKQQAQEQLEYMREERRRLSMPPSSGLLPGAGALPIGPSTLQSNYDPPFAGYAEGGLVEEEEAPTPVMAAAPEPEEDEGAIPITAQPTAGNGLGISPQLRNDAVRGGLGYLAKSAGIDRTGGIRTERSKRAAAQIAAGQGGLTAEEMDAARKAVDPQGKMTDSQRNLAALGSVYQYHANKGNPEGAQRVAAQMLQYYRHTAIRYGAIAAHAAEQGDNDLATQAAVRAYANVPDGRDLKVSKTEDGKLQYTITDAETGQPVTRGIATPQQLAASAMGLASGGFDRALLQAAGQAAPEKGKGAGALKTSDRKSISDSVSEEVNRAKEKWSTDEKNKGKPVNDEHWGNLQDAATHIMQDNPKITTREAINGANQLYTLDPKNPKAQSFKILPGDEDGMNTIKLSTGHKLKLDDDQLEVVMEYRAKQLKALRDKQKTDEDEAKKPGVLTRAGNVAGAIGGALSDVGSAAANVGGILGRGALDGLAYEVPGTSGAMEETRARTKSAREALGRAGNDLYDKIKNQNRTDETFDSPL